MAIIAYADRWECRGAEGCCVEAGRTAAWALHPGLRDRAEHTDALLLHRHIAHAEDEALLLSWAALLCTAALVDGALSVLERSRCAGAGEARAGRAKK